MDIIWEPYFNETDHGKRVQILQKLRKEHAGKPEATIIEEIFERRYGARKGQREGSDFFLRSLLLIQTYSRGVGKLLRKADSKIGRQLMHDLFLDDVAPLGDAGKELLYREYCNCATFYIALCWRDTSYRKKMFGMVSMSDDETRRKLEEDIISLRTNAVQNMGMEKELALFCQAVEDTYKLSNEAVSDGFL